MAEALRKLHIFFTKRAPWVRRLVYRFASVVIKVLELSTGFRVTREINLGNILMLLGRWEPGTTALNRRILQKGMIVVDVGAHVGYYTTQYASLVGPAGKVFAFEPHPGNHALLKYNTAKYPNVTCDTRAVGASTDTATFYESAVGSGSHSLIESRYPHAQEFTVHKTTLDTFFKEKNLHPSFIKVDVEGAEHEVLDGGRELLKSSDAPDLVMEFSPTIISSRKLAPESLPQKLQDLGYHLYVIDEATGETTPVEHWGSLSEFVASVRKVANLLATKKTL